MDELIFRIEQATETFYIQLSMATETGLRLVQQYTEEGKRFVMRAFHDTNFDSIQLSAETMWSNILQFVHKVKNLGVQLLNPNLLYDHLRLLYKDEINRNNLYFISIGIGIGLTAGILIGIWLARLNIITPVMKAIACVSFEQNEDNVKTCNTTIPHLRSSSDILVRVRATSINRLDKNIARGYGRNLRHMIQSYDNAHNIELPLVLGRSCSGVVEGIGKSVKNGLEIGDEVWLATQWYESGLASELVVAHELCISRKPFIIGYEGAASLPYNGCIALEALTAAHLNESNCNGKRILVQDGCSPVGCVLTQLLKKWGAYVMSTCTVRSEAVIKALGADDVITFHRNYTRNEIDSILTEQQIFFQELSAKKLSFDSIFITTPVSYSLDFLQTFIAPKGCVINTFEKSIPSDNYGFFLTVIFGIYVKCKKLACSIFKIEPDWGGPHLNHDTLDTLAAYVNDGILQTVVDQVYTPQEARKALAHVSSPYSIGSTIITFRS